MSFNLLYFRSIGILCVAFFSVWALLIICYFMWMLFFHSFVVFQFSSYFQNRWSKQRHKKKYKSQRKLRSESLWFCSALLIQLLHRPLFISSTNFCVNFAIALLSFQTWHRSVAIIPNVCFIFLEFLSSMRFIHDAHT